MNETLLMAFKEQDTDTVLRELTPLLYKHMKGVDRLHLTGQIH